MAGSFGSGCSLRTFLASNFFIKFFEFITVNSPQPCHFGYDFSVFAEVDFGVVEHLIHFSFKFLVGFENADQQFATDCCQVGRLANNFVVVMKTEVIGIEWVLEEVGK